MFCGRGFICAKNYAKAHLSANDYYEKGKEVKGVWMGEACEKFGVKVGEEVQDKEFAALADGLSPDGLQLCNRKITGPRLASDGTELARGRRSFYDLTLNAPKSFSIMAVTMGDARIRHWHENALLNVFERVEQMTARRVHEADGEESLKRTGAMACARYSHDANRSFDPQIHDHMIVFNLTPDPDDGKNYAVESNEWFRSSAYFTAVYRDSLAAQALNGGYDLEFDADGAPQIKGMGELVKEFSSRSAQIEYLIKECEDQFGVILSTRMRKQITYASRGFDKAKFKREWAALNYGRGWEKGRRVTEFLHLVRVCSDGGLKEATTPEVLESQRERIGKARIIELQKQISEAMDKEAKGVRGIADGREDRSAEASFSIAVRSVFSRVSVETPENLTARAIEISCGTGDFEKIERLIADESGELLKVRDHLTTQENAQREIGIIEAMLEGAGTQDAINSAFKPNPQLEEEQKAAIEGFAKSKDFVVSLIGDAGTGKTFTTTEMVRAAVEAKRKVFMCAPSNGARDVLRNDGKGQQNKEVAAPFLKAESLQMFLTRLKLREDLPEGSVIILDEAGLASVKMLSQLIEEAKERNWRLLFVGDPKQHVAVEAGDAFRAGIASGFGQTWRLSKIRRQKPEALAGAYREAAKCFASGKTAQAFSILEAQGSVHELPGQERIDAIAKRYMSLMSAGKSVICVNPTHREIDEVSDAIRSLMKEQNILDTSKARTIEVFEPSQITEPEHERRELLQPGVHLVKVRGESAGREHLRIWGDAGGGAFLAMGDDGKEKRLYTANEYAICESHKIEVCPSDRLMVGANIKNESGNFINGEIVTVTGFDKDGKILVEGGRVLNARMLSYGYASTSHKSQGSTCDAVILGISARSAANFADKKLAYVGATRGRESIDVYCENSSRLEEIEARTGDRPLAIEGMSSSAKKFCAGVLGLSDKISRSAIDLSYIKTLKEAVLKQAFLEGEISTPSKLIPQKPPSSPPRAENPYERIVETIKAKGRRV